MTAAPTVLFLAPFEPWCRENGSSLIIADLLEGLSRVGRARVVPVFLRRAPGECRAPELDGMRPMTLGIEPLPLWLSIALAVSLGRSAWDTRLPNRRVGRQISRAVALEGVVPTLVHVEHLPLIAVGLHLARTYRVPMVYRAHNVESSLWARRLGTKGVLGQWVDRRMQRDEAKAVAASQLTLCISDVDAEWVRTRLPHQPTAVLPGGLLMQRYEHIDRSGSPGDLQICFVGGLDWAPNENGLRWFLKEVLPLLVARRPDTRVAVLARGAVDRPWIAGNPAVDIMPPETVPRALFANSRLSIAPLLEGGGVRIKILESLAVGCPVVATRIGAEGIQADGLFRADSPQDFANACLDRLRHAVNAPERAAWRAGVRAAHGADEVAGRLVDAWQRVAEEATG